MQRWQSSGLGIRAPKDPNVHPLNPIKVDAVGGKDWNCIAVHSFIKLQL